MKCVIFFYLLHLISQVFSKNPAFCSDNSASGRRDQIFSKKMTCVRKCCPDDEGFYIESNYMGCKQFNSSFPVVFYNNFSQVANFSKSDYYYVYGSKCPENTRRIQEEEFYLQTDGSLLIAGGDEYPDDLYLPGHFCIDFIDNITGALVCTQTKIQSKTWETLIGMIISMPFLLLTFLVYAIIPESNLHRKALMNYVLTLLLAYIFLVVVQLYPGKFDENFVCPALGYLIIFFFLISFFWMNVMCLDMWFAFSGMRGFNGRRLAERKRFLMYFAYAVGVPSLHILVVFLLNRFGDQESNYFPGIGFEKCFLRDGYPNLFYFYGPMAILITVNVTLFILTAVKIQKVKKETSMLKQSESRRHTYEDDKQKFNLYVKLLFAMGINWTMEVISWAIEWRTKNVPPYVWYLTDFCNAMYGVFIFFIFVFKKKIWRSLKKRYYVCIGKPHFAHSVSVTQTTRSSNYSTTETGLNDHRLSELKNGRGEERMLPHN